jgi:DNA-binding IclR family transcriptional regulator
MSALAEAGGDVNIKALAERVSLPASTVHRLLALLMDVGIAERGRAAHSYRVGVEFYRLSALVFSQVSARDLARPFLERVAHGCGEVALLMRYMKSARKVMLEDSVDSPHPLRYSISLYQPLSVLWGASGRSVLAFLPEDEIRAVLAEGERSPIEDLPTPTFDEISTELAAIRSRGYALTFGQKIEGAVGFGAPVFNNDGTVFGSMCVTIPRVRFAAELEAPIARLLCQEANALSAALGFGTAIPSEIKRGGTRG